MNSVYILSIATYSLLTISIIFLWSINYRKLWILFFLLSILTGFFAERIVFIGLLQTIGFSALISIYYSGKFKNFKKAFLALAIVLWGLILSHHFSPGFTNWKIVSEIKLSPDSIPYSFYLNFDKGIVGLFLLLFIPNLIHNKNELKSMVATLIPIFLLGSFLVLLFSFLLGYIYWDPKFPDFFSIWALKMLFFTCLPEELIFRGFIQRELASNWKKFSWGPLASLTTSSFLFGLDHFAGGLKYIFLAFIAGFFYGWVYQKTNRIESSVLFHFLLNTFHILGFSYPALESAFG